MKTIKELKQSSFPPLHLMVAKLITEMKTLLTQVDCPYEDVDIENVIEHKGKSLLNG
jgi:hypothetical protein